MKKVICLSIFLIGFLFIKNVYALDTMVDFTNPSTGKRIYYSNFQPNSFQTMDFNKDQKLTYSLNANTVNVDSGDYAIVTEFYGKGYVFSSQNLSFTLDSGSAFSSFEVSNLGNIGFCWHSGGWEKDCFGYRVTFFVTVGEDTSVVIGSLSTPIFSTYNWMTFSAQDTKRQTISTMTLADYNQWKAQQETNEKLDDINNSINSEDSDISSSKCGMICKLKGIFTGIIELPSKLVSLLIDALKSLFVPTNDQLYEIINDSKSLSENFGFVGESVNFFINIFTSLLGMVNGGGCVELPEFSVGATSLFDKVTFWNAQQVCLSDNVVLSTHIDTIRTVTSIVLVCLFIGFASSKFFNILSKNDSGVTTTTDLNSNQTTYTEWQVVNGNRTTRRVKY